METKRCETEMVEGGRKASNIFFSEGQEKCSRGTKLRIRWLCGGTAGESKGRCNKGERNWKKMCTHNRVAVKQCREHGRLEQETAMISS